MLSIIIVIDTDITYGELFDEISNVVRYLPLYKYGKNPCFSGRYSAINTTNYLTMGLPEVSILVLVEGILQLYEGFRRTPFLGKVSILVLVEGILQFKGCRCGITPTLSFNPCFSGRYSAITTAAHLPILENVSILVLVEGILQ